MSFENMKSKLSLCKIYPLCKALKIASLHLYLQSKTVGFLEEIIIRGNLTHLPQLVRAYLDGMQIWMFIFSGASPLSAVMPMTLSVFAFVMAF